MTEASMRQATARAVSGLKMVFGRIRTILVNENAGKGTQFIQATVSAKEVMDLPRVAEFGFVSRPPTDSDGVVIFLNAERTWGVIIATANQKARMALANDGEMAIHDALGEDGAAGKWFYAKKKADDGTGGGWELEANQEPIVINNAKSVTINSGVDGVILNTTGDVTLNMGGKNVTINNPGSVVLGPAGKKVVVDGDPVIGGGGGHVQASQSVVTA